MLDDSRYAFDEDDALRTSLMVMGANHNFFNTVWTPGKCPRRGPTTGATANRPGVRRRRPRPADPAEQYELGTAYIAGWFRLVQGGERSCCRCSTAAVPPRGRGCADVHTVAQAEADKRVDVAPFTSPSSSFTVSGAATA